MQSLSSGGRTGRSVENNQFADKTGKDKVENISTVGVAAVIPPLGTSVHLNKLSHFEN